MSSRTRRSSLSVVGPVPVASTITSSAGRKHKGNATGQRRPPCHRNGIGTTALHADRLCLVLLHAFDRSRSAAAPAEKNPPDKVSKATNKKHKRRCAVAPHFFSLDRDAHNRPGRIRGAQEPHAPTAEDLCCCFMGWRGQAPRAKPQPRGDRRALSLEARP